METRYEFVTKALRDAIAKGDYPLGSLLPPEIELAERFGVSRSTVRMAMRELQSSGLISRKRSAGTRVEATSPVANSSGFTQALSSIEAVQRFGSETRRDIQAMTEIIADDRLAKKLGCKPGSRWLKISSLRRLPEAPEVPPICWTDVYIAEAVGQKILNRIHGYQGILGNLVEEETGRRIVEIRQDISATGISEALAGPLRAPAGGHALEIRRQYVLAPDTLVEVSISTHPADRFSYNICLRRAVGP